MTEKRYGHLKPPFPSEHCANRDCKDPVLTEETEAVMFTDLETNKLIIFCGSCAMYVELHRQDRWRLVML